MKSTDYKVLEELVKSAEELTEDQILALREENELRDLLMEQVKAVKLDPSIRLVLPSDIEENL